MRTSRVPILPVFLAAVVLAGCSRKDYESRSSVDDGSSVKEQKAPAVSVADVDLGRTVNPDKTIGSKTNDFKPMETIYASVRTQGKGSSSLKARWTYQDGQVVDETTQQISPDGPATTEFHIAKAGGWPIGKYRVEVLLDGNVAATKEFEVKR